MRFADEEARDAYQKAWDEWQKQLAHVHRVFLEGESIQPEQMKGLLNREARKKDAYDAARARLLGLDRSPLAGQTPGENPFA